MVSQLYSAQKLAQLPASSRRFRMKFSGPSSSSNNMLCMKLREVPLSRLSPSSERKKLREKMKKISAAKTGDDKRRAFSLAAGANACFFFRSHEKQSLERGTSRSDALRTIPVSVAFVYVRFRLQGRQGGALPCARVCHVNWKLIYYEFYL